MQLICVDEQHFPSIRKKNGIYVDKTKNIYNLFKDGKYFFIARPRRFGKSLLCSTVAEIFAGNKGLFKGLWIEQSDWAWDNHPVMYMDMTSAASPTADAQIVRVRINTILKTIAARYDVDMSDIADHGDFFGHLIKKLHAKTGMQVVVIIDEYDKPLLDVLHQQDRYPAIHDELRGLYAQLKANSEHLRFVFLTGVFKFAQTSVFSGLNNVSDLTFRVDAAELLGYTEQEIKDYFSDHLSALALKHKLSSDEMLEYLREQHNGYKFGLDVGIGGISEGVYNPFSINTIFYRQELVKRWFVSATPSALVTKLRQMKFIEIDAENLITRFSVLDASSSPENIETLHLLYYAGYLTIKQFDPLNGFIALDFPNAEVAQAMSDLLLPLITSRSQSAVLRLSEQLRVCLVKGRLEDLQELLNQALAQLPYYIFITQEHYYQTVFYFMLAAGNSKVLLEDTMNRGRADLTIIMSQAIYIFELKMNQPASVALAQIRDRGYAEKYRHLERKMYAVGIMLSSEKRVVEEVLFEAI